MEEIKDDGFEMQPLMQAPHFREVINRDNALEIIGKYQDIILTKNLTGIQLDSALHGCACMIMFIEMDHYPKPLFENLFGKRGE